MKQTKKISLKPFFIIGLLTVLFFTSGCLTLTTRDQPAGDSLYTWGDTSSFKSVLAEITRHDTQYGADFRVERLDKQIVSHELIDSMLSDYDVLLRRIDRGGSDPEVLARQVEKDVGKNEKDRFVLLVHIRKTMLESEKEWQLGYKYGDAGLVRDGFFCLEEDSIHESLDHFSEATKLSVDVQYYTDILLTNSPEDEMAMLGFGDQKLKWYYIDTGVLFDNINYERSLVEKHCSEEDENSNVFVTVG